MGRIDRLRSAEAAAWDKYAHLNDELWFNANVSQDDVENALREWDRAVETLQNRIDGIGAHADMSRPLDAGKPEEKWGFHNHAEGRACRRLCRTGRNWDWDGENYR